MLKRSARGLVNAVVSARLRKQESIATDRTVLESIAFVPQRAFQVAQQFIGSLLRGARSCCRDERHDSTARVPII
jgi:hypothetical protein